MVSLETPVCEFDKDIIDFSLPGVDGKTWSVADCRGENGLLVMFICNHCPYVKAIRERIVRDTKALMELGINSVAIMSNDPNEYEEDSFENMQRVAEEFGFPFPYLIDESQEVARAYGVMSWSVEDPAELRTALASAIAHPGPSLVDVIAQPLQDARAPVSEWIA